MSEKTFAWMFIALMVSACARSSQERVYQQADREYQEARQKEDDKSYREATALYLDVMSMMEGQEDSASVRLLGLSQYRLGVVYRSQAMYEEALEMDRMSLAAFSSIDDSVRMLHSLWNMAREFSALKRYDSCKYYYDKSLIMAEWVHADNDKISILGELGSQYYRKIGDYPNAIRYIKLAEELWNRTDGANKDFYASANDVMLAYLYFVSNEDDQAWEYALKGLGNEKGENRVTCYQILYELSKRRQSADSTLYYADAFISQLSENFTQEKNNSVQRVKNDYELRMQSQSLRHSARRRLYLVFALSLLVIAVVLLLLWLSNRKMLKDRLELEETKNRLLRNESRINELMERLQAILDESEAQRTALKENSQREKMLCNRLLEFSNVYQVAKNIENKEYNYKGVLSESDWDDFVVASNAIFEGFIDRISARHSELSKWDLRTLCLLKHGFSEDTIAYLLNIQIQSLKKRLYRMKYVKMNDSRTLEEIINEKKHE